MEELSELEVLATKIYQAFTTVYPNSHSVMNRSDTVIYPYVTYDFSTDPKNDRNQENLVIEVQIFDTGSSYKKTYQVASKLKKHFKGLLLIDDLLDIRFDVQRGASNFRGVPTGDDNIVRLEGTIQAIIDWREN